MPAGAFLPGEQFEVWPWANVLDKRVEVRWLGRVPRLAALVVWPLPVEPRPTDATVCLQGAAPAEQDVLGRDAESTTEAAAHYVLSPYQSRAVGEPPRLHHIERIAQIAVRRPEVKVGVVGGWHLQGGDLFYAHARV